VPTLLIIQMWMWDVFDVAAIMAIHSYVLQLLAYAGRTLPLVVHLERTVCFDKLMHSLT
jgi:hypothetical protein